MRKLTIFGAVAVVALMAVLVTLGLLSETASAAQPTFCNDGMVLGSVTTNVVNQSGMCTILNGTVDGHVSVSGTLLVNNSIINGNVGGTGDIEIAGNGSQVFGNVKFKTAGTLTITGVGNTINGNLDFLDAASSTIAGDGGLLVNGNVKCDTTLGTDSHTGALNLGNRTNGNSNQPGVVVNCGGISP